MLLASLQPDHYVNLRPSRLYGTVGSPLANPGVIDFIVVREGTEGPYVGNGGTLRGGTPHEVATEVSLNTAHGVERVVRDAFRRASERPRKHVTLVHKHNVWSSPDTCGSAPLKQWPANSPKSPTITCTSMLQPSSWLPIPPASM